MNGEQVHLLINHLPIVGSFLGLALALLATARKGDAGALYAAALVLGLSAAGGGVAYLSGEAAEEAVEARPGFDHDVVEEHEDGALLALVLLAAAAAAGGGLSVLASRGRALPRMSTFAWVAITALSAAAMTRQGLSGRRIGHPEAYGVGAPEIGAATSGE